MVNHPNRSINSRPLVWRSWTGALLVGYRSGVIRVTVAAHPGCTAHWHVGHGDSAHRQNIMDGPRSPYTWARDDDNIAADFARLLGGDVVDGDLKDAMVDKWGLDRDAIKMV